MSAYKLSDLVAACGRAGEVFPTRGALITARTDFNLLTERDVRGFIANGGLEQPKFINKAPWKRNPDPSVLIEVDAYAFYSGISFGYIAFLFVQKTSKWTIKSFKKNTEPDPRNLAMFEALKKSGRVH
jgi:hypothetical protein